MKLWGIDLGGTKIEGAIIDPAQPDRTLARMRVPTERHLGYGHVVGQVVKLVDQLEAASGMRRPAVIGFGTPGAIDPRTKVLKNAGLGYFVGLGRDGAAD
jgi:predicted NBD/HSP70 family sugar kinase